jgi:hypothetical protein
MTLREIILHCSTTIFVIKLYERQQSHLLLLVLKLAMYPTAIHFISNRKGTFLNYPSKDYHELKDFDESIDIIRDQEVERKYIMMGKEIEKINWQQKVSQQ